MLNLVRYSLLIAMIYGLERGRQPGLRVHADVAAVIYVDAVGGHRATFAARAFGGSISIRGDDGATAVPVLQSTTPVVMVVRGDPRTIVLRSVPESPLRVRIASPGARTRARTHTGWSLTFTRADDGFALQPAPFLVPPTRAGRP